MLAPIIFIINRVYVLNDFGDQCYTAVSVTKIKLKLIYTN